MLKITDYSEKYDEQLQLLDQVIFFTVKYHADVIKSSICLAVSDDKLIGAGYLKAGSSFLEVDKEELPYYYIHAEFAADIKTEPGIQIEASGMLLDGLKERFDALQREYASKRLILRLWCMADKTAYLEFLISYGFRPMRVTPIMVRQLSDEDLEYAPEKLLDRDGKELEIEEKDPFDSSFMDEYLLTNKEAFEVADSANELRFVMGGPDSHVYAVMKGKRVIAALTLWSVTDKRAATENIFCAKDYRRRGITSCLINYACKKLREQGYEEASLTVFGDNQPAEQLYLGLGYEVEGCMLECHYEKSYKNIGF